MSEMNNTNAYSDVQDGLRTYIVNIFTKMGLGLALTAVVAYFGYQGLLNGSGLSNMVLSNPWLTILLIVVQLGLAVGLSAGLTKLSPLAAQLLFYGYAFITGITFSFLPFAYGLGNVFTAFVFASVLFISCAIIGHTTSVDLSRFQGLLMGGLLALLLATVISMFIPVLRNSLFISYFGIVLFLALTAYDMQRLKAFYYSTDDPILKENLATYGAFQLYLDFINLFLRILQVLGHSRDN